MISKDLLNSRKNIILISMMINIVLILIGNVLFNNNEIHLELSALLILSLLFGPYSIVGFTIVEVIYGILFLDIPNVSLVLFSVLSTYVVGITPWKLWYSINYKKHYEIPNMNSFYSFIKIIIIIFIMILQTYIFFNGTFNATINLSLNSFYVMFILGLIFLLLGMEICGKLNIVAYTPKTQIKKIMPERLYEISFLISIILSIVTLDNTNNYYLVLILILSAIYLIKPYDENVFKISNVQKLSIFNKAFISIFIILIIIPTVILISLQIGGIHESSLKDNILLYMTIFSEFFLAILIPLIIYMLFLERQVIKPINQLSTYLSKEITNDDDLENLINNLNAITVKNEIKSLSKSLLNMQKELVDYTSNLLDATKEKERYETELKLAHEIQYSMIPTDFENFYEDESFSLWGYMKAARDVGGDFYDYFRIDEENIGFVIGDVSGKGVSSALIMVKAMTLIQDYTKYYPDLSNVFYEVNNELCKDNAEELFVTCWLGKLNTKTGELSYVNAGHNKPLIKQDDNNFEFLNERPGLVLAGMEDMPYKKHVINLKPNDTLFLYTDGVTEANDNYNGFYGEENLQKILNQNKDNELSKIIKSVENDVNEFCNNQDLFDDTTMFIIKMN